MKPNVELQKAVRNLQKIETNLRDMDDRGRVILADIAYQADKLHDEIQRILIHGGGTGTD